jgi:hypothetical protein
VRLERELPGFALLTSCALQRAATTDATLGIPARPPADALCSSIGGGQLHIDTHLRVTRAPTIALGSMSTGLSEINQSVA